MKFDKLFIALTAIPLAAMLVSVSAHAGELAFDAAGNLFWADGTSIFKFTPEGKKSMFATGISGSDLAFDRRGDLLASDYGQKSIFKFTPDGKKSTFATAIKVYDMVIDRSDNLYVSDGHSIFKFTPDGNKSTFTTGINAFEMAIDRSGNLYFSEGVLLFKFTPEGVKSTFASGLQSPSGMAFDGAGNLFVAEQDSHSILKFGPDATKSTFASELKPFDMALDRLGNLFVWDGESHSVLKFTPDGTKSTFSRPGSPDQKWEHVGGDEPKIAKAGTNEVALELEGIGGVLWAPDSKRFACYSGGGGRWHTTSLYQLRGDEWKELKAPSPEEEVQAVAEKAIAAQVKKRGLPKKTDLRLMWGTVEVRQWVDSNTAILYAGLEKAVRENLDEAFGAHFLVTLKFDDAGNWKIVKTHQMSKKEIEKEEAGEDVSGSAQTTEQEGPSADASFRDADRHLNEVYDALRARLSTPERDTLKKEQLAWLKRRDAAAQVAKKNPQEKSTEATDGEMTKMTLARTAELEKRLKKAK
jgi:uncharacterized protein YecT (DUF1311 family)/sugar lactone lactonase YvrE